MPTATAEAARLKLRDYGAFGIYFDQPSCRFVIAYENTDARERYDGSWFDTFEKAVEKADRMGKEKPVRLDVRVTKVSTGRHDELEITRGVVTGVHAGNGNWLVKWDGLKTTEQCSRYERNQIRRDLSETEVAKLITLKAEEANATKAYEDYFESLAILELK